ncbi:MAG: YbaN family protein [Bdellovibrionota bacterium]
MVKMKQIKHVGISKNPIVRTALFILGVSSVVLGFIGLFVPVLPTTPFVLLAAWCFFKSSSKAHQWLYKQPLLGTALKDWEQNKSIAKSTKVIAVSMILFSLFFLWEKVEVLWVAILVSVILVGVSLFIATRKSAV